MPIWSLEFCDLCQKVAFYYSAVNLTILILAKILLQTSDRGGILVRYNALGIAFKRFGTLKPLCAVSTNKLPLKQ